MKTIKYLVPYLKNEYIMTFLVFFIWMLFFDTNDLLTQREQRNKLSQLNQDKVYFKEEIERNAQIMEGLETDPEALEKFAREKYLMKKADEDLFVFRKNTED